MPDAVRTIGASAFKGCASLQKMTLGVALQGFTPSLFESCCGITEVIVRNTILQASGSDALIPLCANVTDVSVDETGLTIHILGDGCTHLETLVLRSKEVPEKAWARCAILLIIYASDNLKAIGDDAFHGVAWLTMLDLPAVTSIGERAFEECSSLKGVTLGMTSNASATTRLGPS